MNNKNNIKDLAALFEQFEHLRLSLLQSQDSLIESFKMNGGTTLEGLKDWQDTFCRVLSAQSEIIKQIKNIALK